MKGFIKWLTQNVKKVPVALLVRLLVLTLSAALLVGLLPKDLEPLAQELLDWLSKVLLQLEPTLLLSPL